MKKKKMLVFLFAIVITLATISACSSTSENKKIEGSNDVVDENEEKESVKEEEEITEKIKISVAGIQAMGNEDFPEGNDYDDNVWRDLYRDELGVEIEYKWVAPREQSIDKLNLAISTGDIPDIMTVNSLQFQTLVENDLVWDISELFEEYGSDLMKEVITDDGGVALESAKIGGKLYAIPYLSSSTDMSPVYWVRRDWIDNLGMKIPKTTDDLYNLIKAFKENDPNMTGNDDTVGLGIQLSNNVNSITGICQSFNSFPNHWVEDGAKLSYGAFTQKTKNALDFIKKLYDERLISQEFITDTDEKLSEMVVSGQCGLVTWPWWAPFWALGNAYQYDNNSVWEPFVVSEDGTTPVVSTSKLHGQYYVVSKDCQNPEVLVQMANLFIEKYMGGNSEDVVKYIQGINGENFWQFANLYTWSSQGKIDELIVTQTAIETGDSSKVPPQRMGEYEQAIDFRDNENQEGWAAYTCFGPSASISRILPSLQEGKEHYSLYTGLGTDTMKERGTSLDNIILEGFARYITAGGSFEEIYEKWIKAGGDLLLDEVNTEMGR